jgi:hypothetical protein
MHGPTCIFWANLTPFLLQCQEAGGTYAAGSSIQAVVDAPNSSPVVVDIDNVWPNAWTCNGNYFNDGIWCAPFYSCHYI